MRAGRRSGELDARALPAHHQRHLCTGATDPRTGAGRRLIFACLLCGTGPSSVTTPSRSNSDPHGLRPRASDQARRTVAESPSGRWRPDDTLPPRRRGPARLRPCGDRQSVLDRNARCDRYQRSRTIRRWLGGGATPVAPGHRESDHLLAGWGVGGLAGPAARHQQAQLEYVDACARDIGNDYIWTLNGELRHPSRGHQYVSDKHGRASGASLSERIVMVPRSVPLATLRSGG